MVNKIGMVSLVLINKIKGNSKVNDLAEVEQADLKPGKMRMFSHQLPDSSEKSCTNTKAWN